MRVIRKQLVRRCGGGGSEATGAGESWVKWRREGGGRWWKGGCEGGQEGGESRIVHVICKQPIRRWGEEKRGAGRRVRG